MSCLIFSAHFDDAVLSAGQFLAGRNDCIVATVFSAIPKNKKILTDYDKSLGFKSSREAMEARRWEDGQATALLGADWIHLDWYDSQYPSFKGYVGLARKLKKLIEEQDYEMILAPLGLRHPDHIALSDAVTSLKLDNVYLYEDLPHRVTHPELVVERLKKFPTAKLTFIGDGEIADKIRALMCYKSQINTGDLDPYVLYVPERFHKVEL